MALRKIATLGNPILREVARTVGRDELASPAMQALIDDLIDTMHDANGAGIAAPQIYESVRIATVHIKDNPRYPYKPNFPLTVLVNPVVTPQTTETFRNNEGCLSVPGFRGEVDRFTHVRVEAWGRDGEAIDFHVKGLTSGTFQHELDHLDGKLFVDRVTDTSTFTTWIDFERFHQAKFVERAKAIVAKYGA